MSGIFWFLLVIIGIGSATIFYMLFQNKRNKQCKKEPDQQETEEQDGHSQSSN